MTEPRQRAVTRAEFDALSAKIDEAARITKLNEKAASETHDKVSEIYKALMVPSPGQGKSLLDRMASATINMESGGRVAAIGIKFAAFLAAIGAVWAMLTTVGGKP